MYMSLMMVIALMITTVAVAGASSGKIILVNRPKYEQPSSRALSSKDTGSVEMNWR